MANTVGALIKEARGKAKLSQEALAGQINDRLNEMMQDSRLSLTQALVLVSLDLANNVQKQAELTEKYKSEIADYLNDAANAMSERDKYKRELDRLKGKQE